VPRPVIGAHVTEERRRCGRDEDVVHVQDRDRVLHAEAPALELRGAGIRDEGMEGGARAVPGDLILLGAVVDGDGEVAPLAGDVGAEGVGVELAAGDLVGVGAGRSVVVRAEVQGDALARRVLVGVVIRVEVHPTPAPSVVRADSRVERDDGQPAGDGRPVGEAVGVDHFGRGAQDEDVAVGADGIGLDGCIAQWSDDAPGVLLGDGAGEETFEAVAAIPGLGGGRGCGRSEREA